MPQIVVSGFFGDSSPSPQHDATRHVANTHELDHLVAILSEVVVASQDLSEEDQRRMRNFVCACGDLMVSRTRLEPTDRQIFERELRAAVKRRRGHNDAT